jgi:hypothetical protein
MAAIAFAPLPLAQANSGAPCGTMAQYGASGSSQSTACWDCIISHPGGGNAIANCTSDAPAGIGNLPAAPGAPANPPDDSCKWILNNPQAHVGAYDGCETARRATGSP